MLFVSCSNAGSFKEHIFNHLENGYFNSIDLGETVTYIDYNIHVLKKISLSITSSLSHLKNNTVTIYIKMLTLSASVCTACGNELMLITMLSRADESHDSSNAT